METPATSESASPSEAATGAEEQAPVILRGTSVAGGFGAHAGDVLVWDNTQTLHHSMPYDNDGANRRELYRTQARFEPVVAGA